LAVALVLLAACNSGPLVVDGASKDAAEKSIAEMTTALPDAQKREFEAAIEMGWALTEIAGKTADEVIALARAKKIAEIRKSTIPALQAKIPDAEAAVEAAKANEGSSKRFLAGISLLNPELLWRQETDGSPAPLLTFNMKNDTSEAIQTIMFEVKIGPGGDAPPWIAQRFEFKFVEAVTTGETKFVFVRPDLSQPGNANALQARDAPKASYRYSIDFVRVADLNGRTIMDDEGVAKAEAELQAARDAIAAAEAEATRLEAGGSIAAS
jgi:multidrug resistance efflux pump